MTYEEIVSKTREGILAVDVSNIKGHFAIEINLTGEGEGAFYIELNNGVAAVEPYEYYDRDCKLIISGENYIKMCSGEIDPVKLFTTGKLKIIGNLQKALEISKIFESISKKDKKDK